MTIGDRIKYYRTLAGLTQQELADKLGVHKITISKYERNLVTNLETKTILKIANVLGISPSVLMGWDEVDKEANSQKLDTVLIEAIQMLDPEKQKEVANYIAFLQNK